MHQKLSITLYTERIYGLEIVQLDSKPITCVVSINTTSSPEKPAARIRWASMLFLCSCKGWYRFPGSRSNVASLKALQDNCKIRSSITQFCCKKNRCHKQSNQPNRTLSVSAGPWHSVEYSNSHSNARYAEVRLLLLVSGNP